MRPDRRRPGSHIGPHRNYPHHLFAFGGDASHSVTGAYLASRILLRHYLDDLEPSDEAFGFERLPRSGSSRESSRPAKASKHGGILGS